MIHGFAILLVFQLIGEGLTQALSLRVPGPLIGMLLLFAVLVLRGRAPDGLREAAGGLLQHMMLLFIPAVAGVMLYAQRVSEEWLAFVVASVAGAALTMATCALLLRALVRRHGATPPEADRS